MTEQNELKDLLDRLKGEVRRAPGYGLPQPEERGGSFEAAPAGPPGPFPPAARAPRPERVPVFKRPELQRPDRLQETAGGNLLWRENKEMLLFGSLTSLIAVLGGILSGLEYVTLIGAIAFLLSAFMSAILLFGYYLNFRQKNSDTGQLDERLDQLARKVETMAVKGFSSQSHGPAAAPARDKELEQKVEELRTLVRSLSKVIGQGTGGKG